MTTIRFRLAIAGALLVLGGCVTFPGGPSVMALPGSQMSFDQFRADDYTCRSYASQSIGGQDAQQAAVNSGVSSAVVGTAIGAVAGAAIGGSRGAGVGAGTGLLFGSAAGAGAADTSGRSLQHRYDTGYIQCMYAKGHKVPVAGQFTSSPRRAASPPPPPGTYAPPPGGSYAPPPAPGTYAPPPAGAHAPPPAPER
ncbi:MAG: hypothetical protein GEV05_25205 [Betaproteobacteria bacterium]|nr:hypothetical protein [Betaproteobacteria bacterium]